MVIQWDFIGIQWDINGIYPLVICYIAIEMTIEIVDFPIKNGDVPWFFVCLPEVVNRVTFLIHPISQQVSEF